MTQPKQKTVYIKEKVTDWSDLFVAIVVAAGISVVLTLTISSSYRKYTSVRDGTGEYYHDKFLNKQYREKSHEELCETCKARAREDEFKKDGWFKRENGFWYKTNGSSGMRIFGNTIEIK